MVVRPDRDAAVDMRHDEIAVLVTTAELCRMELGDGLLVEDVRMASPVDALDAGETGKFAILVHVRRVEREGRLFPLSGKLPREHHTEFGRMFRPADTGDRIVIELSVDDGKAARLGTGAAAASDEGIHRR